MKLKRPDLLKYTKLYSSIVKEVDETLFMKVYNFLWLNIASSRGLGGTKYSTFEELRDLTH